MAKSIYRLAKGLHSIHLLVNIYNIEMCEKREQISIQNFEYFSSKTDQTNKLGNWW